MLTILVKIPVPINLAIWMMLQLLELNPSLAELFLHQHDYVHYWHSLSFGKAVDQQPEIIKK